MKALASLITDLEELIGPDFEVEISSNKQTSDLAIACFAAAKKRGQSPNQVALEISTKANHRLIKSCRVDGGYLNLFLDSTQIAKLVEGSSTQDWLPKPDSDRPVIIEYCSINLAKSVSIGHLRNLFIGRGLVNLYSYCGYRVITDNHIGDCGTTFGMWVAGFLRFSNPDKLRKGGNQELNRIYLKVREELETDKKEEIAKEIADWSLSLEKADQLAVDYHQLFSRISLQDLDQSLKLLGIEFDYCLSEAFYLDRLAPLIDDLINRKVATRQSDGTVIVDLSSKGVDVPLLLVKSNGGYLYATTDIATIKYRQEEFNPQRVVYVVGFEQKFHFKQLFAFNSLANYSEADLIHCHYGLILERGEDGRSRKMSSRKGAVLLADVLNQAVANTSKVVKDGISDQNINIIAHGALTFSEFCYRRSADVVFDWDKMLSLKSKSGPYVQYSVVRINSILAKANIQFDQPVLDGNVDFEKESKLLFTFLSYPDVISSALENHDLSLIADHVYNFSRLLNRYYETTEILQAETDELKINRLWLMSKISQQMTTALGLLGVEVPDQM